jgi:hypothetical protein
MRRTVALFGTAAAAALSQGCAPDAPTMPEEPLRSGVSTSIAPAGRARVFTAACAIDDALNAFRLSLGGALNAGAGERLSGRREINWDGVPDAFTSPNPFPGDFFNQAAPAGRARGIQYFSPSLAGFLVSATDFEEVNIRYAGEFGAFSVARSFAANGSNQTAAVFNVAGSPGVPAVTAGFGVVFSDVDKAGSATIRLTDWRGSSLGTFTAPPCDRGFSFVGVTFPVSTTFLAQIQSGEAALGADVDDVSLGATNPDLVIMDDFLYGEPHAIPPFGAPQVDRLKAVVRPVGHGSGLGGTTLRVRLTDVGPGPYRWRIDWGDGVINTPTVALKGEFAFLRPTAYTTPGPHTITIVVSATDPGGLTSVPVSLVVNLAVPTAVSAR